VNQKKTLVFLVGAKKITKKQCLFDKNIVLVFLFDGAVRPHESEPSFSERTSTAACFFFFRPKENRSGAREKGLRKAVFSYRSFHLMKKSARGGPDRKKKFLGGPRGEKNDGCFSRINGIPFGEKRSRLEDQRLFGPERRSVNG
jgi:hypothetical protein